MALIHTVRANETLWSIALDATGTGGNWTKIADKNNIDKKKPTIKVGQQLDIDIGENVEVKTNTTPTPTIEYFGLQAGTDTTIFATWKWDKENTKEYQVHWFYDTGNNDIWFVGTDSTVDVKQSTYSAPSNAKRVRFVVKPISETKTVNKTETAYWTANWSTEKIYSFSDNPPSVPDVPKVELKDYTLTATLDNLDVNGTHIEFQVIKDNANLFSTGKVEIITYHAAYSCTVTAGSVYKVRCRAVRGSEYSEWSKYSDNLNTAPAASSGISVCRANSETSVYLEWAAGNAAETYEIEYSTKTEYFDGSSETTKVSGIEYTHYEITGLETGDEYFFRVRSVNAQGESAWSSIVSVVIGKTPIAPTTWSSTTTCITGEALTLYWLHSAEDGSAQTYAEVEMYVNGVKETHTIRSVDEEEDKKTMHYVVPTSSYIEGTKILWRVRTAGITKTFGEWSIQRTVDVYAPATLSMNVTDANDNVLTTLTSFPFYVSAEAGPNTQIPVSYHLTIAAKQAYESTDNLGNFKMVNAGDEVYSKHYDISHNLLVELSAGSLDLENNIAYAVSCVVAMNSGLTVEATSEFIVAWEGVQYTPNAEIGIDKESLTALIHPYCDDENGDLIEGITLSVYRREFDGTFTELITGLDNSLNSFITDPHPALDYARYRVVATDTKTGSVSYYDIPGYPVGESAVVIQWAEEWSNFEASRDDVMAEPTWSGSMLKLPYNIDVSDSYDLDVSHVEYIGRKHPVTYYGTQRGESSNWNVVIPKDDVETLYALRRLAVWMGDVYVREPSGSGYWANIAVSFSQKHVETTIPVSLSITRVEGGA